jgi:fatty-acid desaturase
MCRGPHTVAGMTRTEKTVNLAAVTLPFAATLAAVVLLWNRVVHPADLAILAAMYLLTALGITVGYHRMLTHRAFLAPKPVEYTLAALGSMAVQGPVISWVADHRKHHAHTDVEGDPHSPHVGHDGGVRGVLQGLWSRAGPPGAATHPISARTGACGSSTASSTGSSSPACSCPRSPGGR